LDNFVFHIFMVMFVGNVIMTMYGQV